jgi:sterol desaturase/sphingolipid hydroxylase (fatty acid hydroxylase superfamily)
MDCGLNLPQGERHRAEVFFSNVRVRARNKSVVGIFLGFLAVAVACAPGKILAHKEPHPLANRIRGVIFWSIFLAAFSVALITARWLIDQAGIKPLCTINLTSVGGHFGAALLLSFVPFFILDGCYYWFHRLQHTVPLLWRFHSVHHSIEELNATNCHHHWTEGLLRVLFIMVPLILLIDLRVPEIPVLTAILGVWGQFVHSNARITLGPLEQVFVSPVFHRVHHSLDARHHNKNFASFFPIFDAVFGTAYFPKPDEVTRTGLLDKREPTTMRRYLFVSSS